MQKGKKIVELISTHCNVGTFLLPIIMYQLHLENNRKLSEDIESMDLHGEWLVKCLKGKLLD